MSNGRPTYTARRTRPADHAAALVTWVCNAELEDEAASRAELALRELTELGQSLPHQSRPPLRDAYREIRRMRDEIHADWAREQEAEIRAEYGWLRAAEAPTNDDLAFQAWEAANGLA